MVDWVWRCCGEAVIIHFLLFSNNFLTLQLNYRIKLLLFNYAHLQSTYFHPQPHPHGIVSTVPKPSAPSLPPLPSMPRWETPLRSSTPAWDPSSSTPYSAGRSSMFPWETNAPLSGVSAPTPSGPQYALLDKHLDGIKVTATINGADNCLGHTGWWGM